MKLSVAFLLGLLTCHASMASLPESAVDEPVEAQSRAVGGAAATLAVPYVVLIKTKDAKGSDLSTCAGAVLGNDTLVTTALCVYNAASLLVSAGSNDPGMAGVQKVTSTAADVRVHPDFYTNTLENDIAIVKVSPAFDGQSVKPISIAANRVVVGDSLVGKDDLTVYGWGASGQDGASVLQKTSVSVMKQRECSAALKTARFKLPEGTFCTAASTAKTICTDDLGSPAVAKLGRDTVFSLVGLASHGTKCPSDDAPVPNVFTRVAPFTRWIASIKWDAEASPVRRPRPTIAPLRPIRRPSQPVT